MISYKIEVAIIEDNQEALKNITDLLSKISWDIKIVGIASSITDGINLIKQHSPQLVFMDIQLEDGLAFTILDDFEEPNFDVIFTTAFNDYYEAAMEYYAFNYLLKPIEFEKLKKIFQKYNQIKERHLIRDRLTYFRKFILEKKIVINKGNEFEVLELDQIVSLNADGNYTQVILSDSSKILASRHLKHYERILIHKGFFRANRSVLLNINHISTLSKSGIIILSNKERIEVSLRNKDVFEMILESFKN